MPVSEGRAAAHRAADARRVDRQAGRCVGERHGTRVAQAGPHERAPRQGTCVLRDHPYRARFGTAWDWFTYFHNALAARAFLALDLLRLEWGYMLNSPTGTGST